MTSSVMLAQLRAVLCDIEQRVPSDDWVDVLVSSVMVPTFENEQRARRRRLEGLGRLAEVVRSDPDFELARDCRPAEMSALVRADREAAVAFSVNHPSIEADQAVLVSTLTKVFVYMNGRYAYTGVQPSSLFVGSSGTGVFWQLEFWQSWPLDDVLDVSDWLLDAEPGLAALWREKNARPLVDFGEPGVSEPHPAVMDPPRVSLDSAVDWTGETQSPPVLPVDLGELGVPESPPPPPVLMPPSPGLAHYVLDEPETSSPAIEVVESTDLSMDDLEDTAKRIREANALADKQESLDKDSDVSGDEGDAEEFDHDGLEAWNDAGLDLPLNPPVAGGIVDKASALQGFLGISPGRVGLDVSGKTVSEVRANPKGSLDPPAPSAVGPSVPGFLPDGPAGGGDTD